MQKNPAHTLTTLARGVIMRSGQEQSGGEKIITGEIAMLVSQVQVDGQNVRPKDRIEFSYHGTIRHGTVEEIRDGGHYLNLLVKGKDGYKQFHASEMTDVRVKSIWGYVRRLIS